MSHKDTEKRVVLSFLSIEDQQVIREWPAYPDSMMPLDYALRPGGWLDHFPESPVNCRFAARYQGKLIGFSMLVGEVDQDREFYIALHPNHLGQGFGQAITQQTVEYGFQQLRLKRIHLKVREWHTGAMRLYASVGFRPLGTLWEEIQGQPVKFIAMEITSM